MEKKLAQTLTGAVAIPYDNDLLVTLTSLCRNYSEEDLLSKVDECSLIYVTGIVTCSFREHINTGLDELNSDIVIPDIVLVRLALFSVYATVMEEEDDLRKPLYATMFMNAILLAKGNWGTLSNESLVSEIYAHHISRYFANKDKIISGKKTSIIKNVAETPSYYIQNPFSESDIEGLQSVVKDAALFRCDILLSKESYIKETNPFIRMYKMVSALVDGYEYLYFNYDSESYIRKVASDDWKNSKKVSNVLADVGTIQRELNSDTSVLLRLIGEDNVDGSDGLLQKKFSVMEFGIYLYYELLIERIIDNISE